MSSVRGRCRRTSSRGTPRCPRSRPRGRSRAPSRRRTAPPGWRRARVDADHAELERLAHRDRARRGRGCRRRRRGRTRCRWPGGSPRRRCANVVIGATGPKISSRVDARRRPGRRAARSARRSSRRPRAAVAADERPGRRSCDGVVDELADDLVAAFASISGPTSTPSSCPRPTRERAHPLGRAAAPNSSATDSWTRKRLAAVQASPMLRILAIIAPSTAASTSASSKTRNGALPPSSIEHALQLVGGLPTSTLPTGGRAGEAHLAQPRRRISVSLTSPVCRGR